MRSEPDVSYSMSATIDGKSLPPLVAITANACYDGYGGYAITFAGKADFIPQALDDEMGLELSLALDDASQVSLGVPIDFSRTSQVQASAHPTAFLDPAVLGTLTTPSGSVTLSQLSSDEISGTISITFADPSDSTPLVDNSLTFEVEFRNLPVLNYCPEP